MEKCKEVGKYEDPYSIIIGCSDNYIQFRKNKVYFPFDCSEVVTRINSLRDTLFDKNVCSTDLQSYPIEIFKETELRHYPDLAGWIYNIIETWVIYLEETIHQDKKKRIFDSFLKICETLALEAKALPPQQTKINTATHREIMFAHHYKLTTCEAENKTATEWQNERKGRAKLEYYTTIKSKNSKSYKAETIKELTNIVQLLEGFKAQTIASNNLDQLQNQ